MKSKNIKNNFSINIIKVLFIVAVIVLILVLIMPLFVNKNCCTSKYSAFKSEIIYIYQNAKNQWITDSNSYKEEITYYRYNSNSKGTITGIDTLVGIDLLDRTDLDYYITINKSGVVTHFYATDGSYQYYWNTGEELKINNIDATSVDGNNTILRLTDIKDNNYVCIGSKGGSSVSNGSPVYPYVLGANNTFSSNTICY